MCVEGVVSSADLLSGMKRKQSFLVQSTKKKLQPFKRARGRKLVSFHICALKNDIPARWNNVHSMSNTFDENLQVARALVKGLQRNLSERIDCVEKEAQPVSMLDEAGNSWVT